MILKRGYTKRLINFPLLALHLIQLALPLCGSESPPLCSLPWSHGTNCGVMEAKFYFDSTSGVCRGSLYHGCGGNENRFETMEACEEICDLGEGVCVLPPTNFICQDFLHTPVTRYYFSNGQCVKFGYFGCPGNGNNFHTLEECLNTCSPPSLPTSSPSPSKTLTPTTVISHVVMATDVLPSPPQLVSTYSQHSSSPLSSSPPMTVKEQIDSSTTTHELLSTTVATRSDPTVSSSWRNLPETPSVVVPKESTPSDPVIGMTVSSSWRNLPETPSVVVPKESTPSDPVIRMTEVPTSGPPVPPTQDTSGPRSSDSTEPPSFGLSVYHFASIGVGVLIVILLVFLMCAVSALVYRHWKVAKRHRKIPNSMLIKASTTIATRRVPLPLKPLSLHIPSDTSQTCSSTGSVSSSITSHTSSSHLPVEIYV